MKYLFLFFGMATLALGEEAIKGSVVDVSDASIPRAVIRVLSPGTRLVLYRAETDDYGRYSLKSLNDGEYLLDVWAPGFRAKLIENFVVRRGDVIDAAGRIHLDVGSCDAPNVFCDSFIVAGEKPLPPEHFLARTAAVLHRNCGIDLKTGAVLCEVSQMDLEFSSGRNGELYLTPERGTEVGLSDVANWKCGGAEFERSPLRIDGLGRGHDFCARTKDGHVSHIFLTQDVNAMTAELQLWIVTRD